MALAKDNDVRVQARATQRAQAALSRSHRAAQAAFDDSIASQFVETWTDLSSWTLPSTPGVAVNGGKLVSTGSGGGASGANKAVSLAANETLRAVFLVNITLGGGSGGLGVGFSMDAAGAVPAAAGGKARGLYIKAASNQNMQKVEDGVFTDITTPGTLSGGGLYVVTLTADEQYISIVARNPNGTQEWRQRWTRPAANIINLWVFNSDARGASGHSFGAVAMRRAIATTSPRAAVEGNGPTVHWTRTGDASFRIALPAGYDSRVPSPAVVMFHGNGSDENLFADNGNGRGVANAFLTAGFIVASAAHAPAPSTWSNDNAMAANRALSAYLFARYAISSLIVYGNSMGGGESLNALARNIFPGVAAWIGTVPSVSLASAFAKASTKPNLVAAYGLASDGSDFAQKTAGHDAVKLDPRSFGGLPMWVLVATDDDVVDTALNWDAIEAGIAATSPDYTRVNVTGGHSTGQITTLAGQMVAFAQRHAA